MNIAGRVLDFRPGAVFQRTFQGGERPGFAQGAFGNFLSGMIAADDHMSAGTLRRVQPVVVRSGQLEGQRIASGVPSAQKEKTVTAAESLDLTGELGGKT